MSPKDVKDRLVDATIAACVVASGLADGTRTPQANQQSATTPEAGKSVLAGKVVLAKAAAADPDLAWCLIC